ncbi:uncharacterized protein BDW43DRAFT_148881 [Aspergillus alliaceus]|uniref:uncharacterized protein n=1 Tax=Petromyces alliaceus TaxID=209559 RepID=UPI0012A76853|nr:uncharacterized protein BDW43DRAFT_148881 [Aspergillus alliaceus]KAB8230850.1 hypothetical protein BDW43DRAFT_148881 [Aspergillus alliaceus]
MADAPPSTLKPQEIGSPRPVKYGAIFPPTNSRPPPDLESQNYSTFAFPLDPSSPRGIPPPRRQGGGGVVSLVVFGLVILGIVLLFALS